ncbi:MAG TPA: hypothetical protein DDZ51_05555 [Planctomycetaceae bacterium]|nr:hypothetical protein [Planctomycetaceae bacterium]
MITYKVRASQFERVKLHEAIEKSLKTGLMRAGALVRLAARGSIKPAPKRQKARNLKGRHKSRPRQIVSRPGQPPRMHTSGNRNLKLILFAWDDRSKSVVVGPMLFKTTSGVKVTEVLEHGGRTVIRDKRRKRSVRIAARPFMRPALASEAPKFPNLFANSVK